MSFGWWRIAGKITYDGRKGQLMDCTEANVLLRLTRSLGIFYICMHPWLFKRPAG